MGTEAYSLLRRGPLQADAKLLQLERYRTSVICVLKIYLLAGMEFGSCEQRDLDHKQEPYTDHDFRYQAVMVPLVCVFSSLGKPRKLPTGDKQNIETTEPTMIYTAGEDAKRPEQADMHEWKALIEKAIQFFERMNRWSVAAKKSRDVVSRLYEASKVLSSDEFEHSLSAQVQSIRVNNPSLNLGTVVNSETDQIDAFENTQLPYSISDMMTEDIWGLSPNGAAAMNNFWFDDMMWDVPVADIDMFENTGNGLSYSELDWLASLDTQTGSDQTWQFQQ